MGSITPGAPNGLVVGLRDILRSDSFVETGTHIGSTTIWASQHFQQVTTIEASEQLFKTAENALAGISNVCQFLGNSSVKLCEISAHLPRSIFWLDAHWSGDITAGEEEEGPLLSELAAIMPWFQRHAILIDDARLFLSPPPSPHKIEHWPSLDEIINVVQSISQAYTFVHNDVLGIVSIHYRVPVSRLLRELVAAQPR